jgi:hypothetical protein
MIGRASLIIVCLLLSLNGCVAQQGPSEINASISEIQADPLKYDGKVVRLRAWVRSSPYGISLESDSYDKRIPMVRADSEGVQLPPQLREVKDQLYSQMWEYIDNNRLPDTGAHGARVELDGYVRLLKKDGKLTNEFRLYGQRPIEIIPLKIIKIETYP